MEIVIVPEALPSLADHEEVSCRECNRETHDRGPYYYSSLREPYASYRIFFALKAMFSTIKATCRGIRNQPRVYPAEVDSASRFKFFRVNAMAI